MRALLCRELGAIDALRVEELASPRPAAGQVLIDVKAAAANFPDVLMVEGRYQFKPPMPFAPGCEVAGKVVEVGAGVTHVKAGDAVLAIVPHGGFAEEAVADESRVVLLPAGANLEIAAAFMFTYATSYHALRDRAALSPGETLLVLGAAGGVGLAAVELGRKMGARVIAAASSEEKLEACRSRGAAETINYATEDLRERVKELTQGRGVDVVLDPVGGPYTEPALRSLAWRGRLLVVGFANGEIPRIPLNLALLKGCAIVGVFWGEFVRREPQANAQALAVLARWYAQGLVKPVIDQRLPMRALKQAYARMGTRQVRGKLLLVND